MRTRILTTAVLPFMARLSQAWGAAAEQIEVRDVGRIVKGLAVRARLPAGATLSGHSMRVGMACDRVGANVDAASIMQGAGLVYSADAGAVHGTANAERGAIARFYKLG